VVKPDQLIKRRGKLGLIKGDVTLHGAKDFIFETLGKEISVRKKKHRKLISSMKIFSF